MVRRVGELVTVRMEEAPASFLWRDRLYVVREVFGHWRERQAWWTSAAARAVHGDAPERAPAHGGGGGGDRGQVAAGVGAAGVAAFGGVFDGMGRGVGEGGGFDGEGARSGTGTAGTAGAPGTAGPVGPGSRVELEQEREVWRVEAGAGRAAGTGVYDLCRDLHGTWRLLRVSD